MQKSIKKVIAGAVAALMITSSMPFTALAAPGDYNPDIQLQFSTVCNLGSNQYTQKEFEVDADEPTAAFLNGAPLVYDAKTGTLTLKQQDANVMEEYNFSEDAPVADDYDDEEEYADALAEYNALFSDADYTYQQGDVFAVTVRMDNISKIWGSNIYLRYSDNLVPAGLTVTSTKKAKWNGSGTSKVHKLYYIGTQEEADAYVQPLITANKCTFDKTETLYGFGEPVEDFSASGLYEGVNLPTSYEGTIEDPNYEEGSGWSENMLVVQVATGADYVDVSGASSTDFYDIDNHVKDDDATYTYTNKAILATFIFEIAEEGAINFDLQDPKGENFGLYEGAYVISDFNDGIAASDATTYAVNVYNPATKAYDAATPNPGSTKLTFMGKNINNGEEPQETKYTINFLDVNGKPMDGSGEYDEGAAVAIPDLPETWFSDETNKHYTYAWNATPSATATADATYQVVETAGNHSYGDGVVDPDSTCTAVGTKTFTCTVCGKTYTETVAKKAHDYGEWSVYTPAVPATCTEDGTTAVERRYCQNDGCDAYEEKGGAVDPKLGHKFGEWTEYAAAVPATCTEDGTTAVERRYCQNAGCEEYEEKGGTVDPKLGHKFGEWTEYAAEIPATKKDAGTTAVERRYCQNAGCEEYEEKGGEPIPALGYTVTLEGSDIGTVTGDLAIGANNRQYGDTYTVTASTAVEGAVFVGWELNGKLVSEDATYTSVVYGDVTITPVFTDAKLENITVTFYDKYGNTVKQYKDVTAEDYQAAVAADIAAGTLVAPSYPSWKFTGWEKNNDEILAISESTTVWGVYEQQLEAQYGVSATGDNAAKVNVEVPAGVDENNIPYDTKVTVSAEGATAWKINGEIVAYGDSYSFYVGSEINVEPVFDEIAEADIQPSTVVVGANLTGGTDYKYNIVATRNIPDGYELVDYGFVYGKDLTDADLDLDKVGENGSKGTSGVIKAVHGGTRNTESNEFAFNYGIKSKSAPITAKSFVIVTKGGETSVIYSDMFVQAYPTV
jgi:hypothetical protein